MSDQRSFNTILNGLSRDEYQRHVKLYAKSILNAFPSGTNYVATEDYEPPTPDGDETEETRVITTRGNLEVPAIQMERRLPQCSCSSWIYCWRGTLSFWRRCLI